MWLYPLIGLMRWIWPVLAQGQITKLGLSAYLSLSRSLAAIAILIGDDDTFA